MTEQTIGCGDNSCVFSVIRPKGGMGTNGGCRCFKYLVGFTTSSDREEVRHVERSTRMLAQEVYRLREEAKYHDEADVLRKLRERERDEAREQLEWQAACTKALMESQERLAAEVKALSAALVLARNVIAANRLVLGEYMGVRDIGEVEKRINAALNGEKK